jgi:hypothetical protein
MVRMGLRKGLSLIRGMRKELSQEQQERIAETIVHELETTNWKIEQGPPARPPGLEQNFLVCSLSKSISARLSFVHPSRKQSQ